MMNDWPSWIDLGLKVLGAVGGLIGTLCGLAVLLARNTLVTKDHLQEHIDRHDEEHDALTGRLAEGDSRFVRLETQLLALPTKDDVTKLRVDISRLTALIEAKGESDRALSAQVTRLISSHMKEA